MTSGRPYSMFVRRLKSDYVLERFIPTNFKSQLPTVEEVEEELTRRMEITPRARRNMV